VAYVDTARSQAIPRGEPTLIGRACVGVDLAGVERNPTGVAVLRGGRLE
jgi:hypothetical protein